MFDIDIALALTTSWAISGSGQLYWIYYTSGYFDV